jgi:hypothetical protein
MEKYERRGREGISATTDAKDWSSVTWISSHYTLNKNVQKKKFILSKMYFSSKVLCLVKDMFHKK